MVLHHPGGADIFLLQISMVHIYMVHCEHVSIITVLGNATGKEGAIVCSRAIQYFDIGCLIRRR